MRVVNARLGVVLTPAGGALAKMLPAFRFGVGGPIGSGRQMVSWISIDDVVYALLHALTDERLHGPVNLTAPVPVSQRALARAIGETLGRPSALAVPRPLVSALFGQMGREMLLGGAHVVPRRLTETGISLPPRDPRRGAAGAARTRDDAARVKRGARRRSRKARRASKKSRRRCRCVNRPTLRWRPLQEGP